MITAGTPTVRELLLLAGSEASSTSACERVVAIAGQDHIPAPALSAS